MSSRRQLLIALGAGALVAPLASLAQQQAKVWRVGFLPPRPRPASLDSDVLGAFPQRMREFGYVEGKNLVIEWRSADGKVERLPGQASELVRLKVDAILAAGTPATSAAQNATTTISIVMVNVGDPVDSGFVRSLAHPGGNITGLTTISGDLVPKQLELLLSMVPKLYRVAVLMNPDNPVHATRLKSVQVAAKSSGVTILPVEARSPPEIDIAISMMARGGALWRSSW